MGRFGGICMNCLYPVLAIVAGVVGVVIGIVTRPTYLGVQVPMDVLGSSARADAPFKTELTNHLLLTGGIGLVLGVIFAFILALILKAQKPA